MKPLTIALVAIGGGLGSVVAAWGLAVLLQPRNPQKGATA